jgi:hypothetical protein
VRRLPFCVAPARFGRLSVSLFLTARRGGLLPTGLVAEADRQDDPSGGEAPRARRPGAGVGGRTGAGTAGDELLRLRRLL